MYGVINRRRVRASIKWQRKLPRIAPAARNNGPTSAPKHSKGGSRSGRSAEIRGMSWPGCSGYRRAAAMRASWRRKKHSSPGRQADHQAMARLPRRPTRVVLSPNHRSYSRVYVSPGVVRACHQSNTALCLIIRQPAKLSPHAENMRSGGDNSAVASLGAGGERGHFIANRRKCQEIAAYL